MKVWLQKYNLFVLAFFVLVAGMPSFALDFDVSVDEEIRKNYNPSKLEMDNLPPLPRVKPSNADNTNYTGTKPVNKLPQLSTPTQSPVITAIDRSTARVLPWGTKFTVKSLQGLSDSMRPGTRVSFVSIKPVTKKYIMIPEGTIFHGEVVDSHYPQKTGNGGLIVIKIDSINFKSKNISINAKITKANYKKIFVNNIKGKRQYWKNVSKQVNKGENFYRKTRRASAKLSNNPVGTIISPIPTVVGMGTYAINLVGSPVVGLFGTGGRVSIPAGSQFEIKLVEDAYLPN